MKYFMVLVLVASSVIFAKPTAQEQKIIKEAGESLGIDLSFSKEVSMNNVEKTCLKKAKETPLNLKETAEIEAMVVGYCVAEYKSLK